VPGTLQDIAVKPGQQVQKGDKLGALANVDLDLMINELKSKIAADRVQERVKNYQRFVLKDDSAALAMGPLQESLKASESQLAERLADYQRLQLVAPAAGTVLLPPEVQPQPDPSGKDLPNWSGTPLRKENLGAFLEPSVVFCQIGDPHKWEANIVIDQDDIEFVHVGQDVKIKLDLMPFETFKTTIDEIGPQMEYTSRQLSSKGGGGLMSKQEQGGVERPINTSYQARAAIDDESALLVQGLRGTAKIAADWQPIGKRVWRYIMRTFNFRL
jgi:putative peptide zinc metalloprotease protein